jgi:hypothetical protein
MPRGERARRRKFRRQRVRIEWVEKREAEQH